MLSDCRRLSLPMGIWNAIAVFAIAASVNSILAQSSPAAEQRRTTAETGEIVILAFGDSLTAGYQLPPGKSFPSQLEQALKTQGDNVRVINSGVSGDTAADGLARLDWSLTDDVDAVIVELGANDALRGFEPAVTEAKLDEILTRLKERNLPVLLAGMEAPRNWGPDYAKAFAEIFPRLAEKHGAILFPFFLQDVATRPELNQADGLHPTPEGVAVIVENILPSVKKLIEQARAGKQGKTQAEGSG